METTGFTENQLTVREAVSQVCSEFPNIYWQERDQTEQDPKEFHAALAKDGWLGIALPESLGGSGLGISEDCARPSESLSLFCIDLDRSRPGLDTRKIKKMGGRAVDANEVFFDDYRIPAGSLVGREGQGFEIILHGMNAERCLLAAVAKASAYARDRVVFNRPIGQNQTIAHPLADAYMKLKAAKLATYHAARLYDASRDDPSIRQDQVGVAANSAKYVAAEAAFTACERAVLTHGGMGYAAEYDVERYLREIFVPRIAPVSRKMIMSYISEKVLNLPRSY
ncbi:Acyl-CoA dehydrogenase fadE12 [Colletotrichum shisoi]|uniref:Acyl-CoA dehydrogenase fadE12 n=1 Tax=Colletotrichum shisoi TaxID=2078593 RepID=A0A5Q4BBB6_9PEZI|nr:Acyl-CoA dehydrogenase fadE12 [Colletotrichum shisoi]